MSRAGDVEHLTHIDTATDELGARRLDVGYHEEQSLCRAWRGRRHPLAEVDRGRRARRRELYAPKMVTDDEVGIEPPAQAAVELLGAIDVRDGNGGDLELHVDRPRSRGDRSFAAHWGHDGHGWSPRVGCGGASYSLAQREKRLAFLDDVGGELGGLADADVLHRVWRSVRDEQHLAGLDDHRRPAVELILERTFGDVDEFFARMRVPDGRHAGTEFDEHLDDLAPGGAEIVAQEIGALDVTQTHFMSLRHGQGQDGRDEQGCCCRDGAMCFHDVLLRRSGLRAAAVVDQGAGRSGRNAARSSVAKSSGCSQAAKWPPFSASLK